MTEKPSRPPKQPPLRLRRTKDLHQYTIAALDTDIGKVHDFYFDDEKWTIRYIVVATGLILAGRKVLISPLVLRHPAWSLLHLNVNLTSEQVASSPSIDLDKPVSRRHEAEHHKHYGLPHYWEGKGVWGSWPNPKSLAEAPRTASQAAVRNSAAETHLRSAREVTGYHIKASDGEIGHLADFLFDDETWEIRYAIIAAHNWWPGKKVLLRPQWIKRVSSSAREIDIKMSRDAIRKSPKWDPNRPVSREYELRLHTHYGYPPYWTPDE
ncbi:MAG: PRC-barrel domain-containing protein [Candidatus Acidiferrales bacterium]